MVSSLMLVFSITAAITCSGMSDWLMELLYKENTAASSNVFKVLIYGIIPISLTYVFGTLLTAAGKLKQLNLLACGTLIINVVVNLLCIPRWGAEGSAWASLTAQSFMALAQVVIAMKTFRLKISLRYILKIILFTLIIGCCFIPTLETWWLRLVVVGVVGTVFALLLNLIDLNEIKNILNEKER